MMRVNLMNVESMNEMLNDGCMEPECARHECDELHLRSNCDCIEADYSNGYSAELRREGIVVLRCVDCNKPIIAFAVAHEKDCLHLYHYNAEGEPNV